MPEYVRFSGPLSTKSLTINCVMASRQKPGRHTSGLLPKATRPMKRGG